ncbi:zinc ribbon domain-containing protein [Nocardioides daejeonensis]|uniref:zinc ribbon domain-containing protein n=1 Tax=Nocardioides daejeonensis TaxID=1046556 RepID=UPI001951F1EB|nr:zinc ribbon domain-containing protein [Nocardioides daejeonensis]
MTPCPHCGAATTPGAPFCGSCGRQLAPASTPDPNATQVRPATPNPSQPLDPSSAETAYAPQPPAQPQPPAAPQAQQWGQPQDQQPQQPPAQQWGQPQGQQPPQQQWAQPQAQPGQQGWGQPQGQQPYGAPQQQWAQPVGGNNLPKINVAALLGGNWIGMGMVAGAALAVALVVNLLIAFTMADDLKVGSAIALAFMLAGATFGPDLRVDLGDDMGQSIGQYPSLATLLALGVAVFLFRRFTAGHRDVRLGLGDAARVGVILSAVSTVLAIIFTAVKPEIEGYDGNSMGLVGSSGETGLSIAGAIFLPFLLSFTVLALSCLVRGDWMQGVFAKIHAWIAAPLYGVAALAALTLGAGLIYLICAIIGDDDARDFNAIMGMVGVLPSLGIFMITLGVFSQVGSKTKYDGDTDKSFDRLGDFADDHGAIFWIAPVVAILVAAAIAYVVIMKSTDRTKVQRNILVLFGAVVVVLPFLIRIANVHFKQWNDDDDATSMAGADGFQTVLLFLVLTAIMSAVMLVVTGNLDVNAVKAKAQQAASQAQAQYQQQQAQWQQQQAQQQAQAQQWQQQQGQQQWGQQPPAQQPPAQPGQQQWGQQPPAQQPPAQPGQQQWGQQPPAQQPPAQPGQQQWGQPPQQ